MDQYLVAMLAVVGFALFALGYYIGVSEGDGRRPEPMESDGWPL